ncbi:MAG: CoA transferase [Proteobacteria bacterium]|nr:CoA transferase [Pseudomonadota bacterium]NIS72599.1 CoA transferase [Pseudomonadota bacterium]
MSLPLDGIKIVDLTAAMAGPFCTQLLADFGAEVLKIEPPGRGDMLRDFGPPYLKGESPYYLLNNRNKRSMTLDIRTDKGRDVLIKLLTDADLLVENYRPNVKKKLKIEYETLREINPRLIYCSISGYGQTGPYADRPGFDPIAQGMSGLSSITGWKNTGPVRVGVAIGDSLGGIFGMYGILLALIERERSGEGQRVETSILEGLIAVLGFQAAKYFATGERPEPQGNDHAMMSPYGTFKTQDGYMNIAAGNQAMWERLAKAIGLEDLIKDERFLTVADRVVNRPELTPLLEKKLTEKTSKEWEKILNEAGVANGPILPIDEVFHDPQVIHQEMLLEQDHPTIGKIKTIGFPTKLSRTPASLRLPPPLMGEHTEEVLKELGYSGEEIKQFRDEKVI